MFGLGFWEIVAIVVVLFLFVKPERIPDLVRKIGRGYGWLSRMTRGFREGVDRFEREARDTLERSERNRRAAADSDSTDSAQTGVPADDAGENATADAEEPSIAPPDLFDREDAAPDADDGAEADQNDDPDRNSVNDANHDANGDAVAETAPDRDRTDGGGS